MKRNMCGFSGLIGHTDRQDASTSVQLPDAITRLIGEFVEDRTLKIIYHKFYCIITVESEVSEDEGGVVRSVRLRDTGVRLRYKNL